MAVRHGYGKVAGTDALIFAYDTGDTRNSYKGEPTVNLAINPTFSSTSNWLIASNGGGTFSVLNNYGKITAGSTGSYSYVYQSINTTVASNENITWSIEFKNNVIGDYAIRVVLFLNGTPKTQPTTFFTLDGTGGIVRKSVTASHVEGGNSIRIDILQGSYYARINTDNNLEFTNAQLERNSHATPFVNGTRSSTQGLLDLTGRSTVDIANVSFNSNAQMTFDGTDDQFTLNDPNTGTTFSMEFIVKANEYSSNPILISPNSLGYDHFVRINSSGKVFARFVEVADSSTDTYVGTTTLALGKFYHVTVTKSPTNGTIYVNGVAEDSHTPTLPAAAWSGTWKIGARGNNTFWFNGEIPVVKIYNRALTADEVRNNFQQYKTRFNI